MYIFSRRQREWNQQNYFGRLNIQNLISLISLFLKGRTLQPFQFFLHDKGTSFCWEVPCKQCRKTMINGPCSLPSRTSLTPLPFQHSADSWVLIWKQRRESQENGSWRGWGERRIRVEERERQGQRQRHREGWVGGRGIGKERDLLAVYFLQCSCRIMPMPVGRRLLCKQKPGSSCGLPRFRCKGPSVRDALARGCLSKLLSHAQPVDWKLHICFTREIYALGSKWPDIHFPSAS